MGWSNGMGAIFNQSEVSISFKTGGYTKCTNIRINLKNTSHGNAIFSTLS